MALDPLQMVVGGTVTVNEPLTVTVAVVVPVHPDALVPVMVYVVVEAGLAVTLAPVVALKPVAGDQV